MTRGAATGPAVALALRDVGLVRDGRPILTDIDWQVRSDERWVVLGANGSGKTTLLRIASLWLHPSTGDVTVLGETLGRTDVRTLRARIGLSSQAFADLLRADLRVLDAVVTAKHAALEPWWHSYSEADHAHARVVLDRVGVVHLAERTFGSLSSGERQRVQLARTLFSDPGLLLLDEPTAGLDLGGREDLVGRLAGLAADPATPPTVLVTHHVEEIPHGFTHLLLLRQGRTLAAGPLTVTLTEANLSTCFDLDLRLASEGGRYRAWSPIIDRGPHGVGL
jgi:iron complex transport system ATP-binding protein